MLLKTTFRNLRATEQVSVLAKKVYQRVPYLSVNLKKLESVMEPNNLVDKYAFCVKENDT